VIRGAIFDMDGVLVNNARYHIRAWQQLGKELGKEFRAEDIRRVFGRRNREMLAVLTGRQYPKEELERITGHKEELYRAIIGPEIVPMTGLVEFLGQLKKAGLKAAVATSGPKENVEFVMERLNIGQYFDAIATGGEVQRAKPAPDIFLLAAQRLGLPPLECVVFEDSTAGIEAATSAGCPCIALSTTHTPAELARTSALKVFPDFKSIEVADLTKPTPGRQGTRM